MAKVLLFFLFEQRCRTKTFDILQIDWVLVALERIRTTDTPEFADVMSALYVKDDLIAAHLGMRTTTVMHHWFPSFYYPWISPQSAQVINLGSLFGARP